MIPSSKGVSSSNGITPEMLAGVTVRIEAEEDFTIRPCQAPQTAANAAANGTGRPMTDQLAGVYVQVEAYEDLTVRPVRL